MTAFRGIPIVTAGSKYRTPQGFSAIKHGVKQRGDRPVAVERKPEWLKIRFPSGDKYAAVRETVRTHELATVCEEDSIETALDLVIDKRVSHLPVVDSNGCLVGLVTSTDLLRACHDR